MTIQECYEKMGGDYADVVSRLRTDERIQRFLLKVADDKSFAELESSLKAHDIPTAFRAAHTLKGVCLNLSITRLYKSASAMTEELRGKTEYSPAYEQMLEKVREDYELTVSCIKAIG